MFSFFSSSVEVILTLSNPFPCRLKTDSVQLQLSADVVLINLVNMQQLIKSLQSYHLIVLRP